MGSRFFLNAWLFRSDAFIVNILKPIRTPPVGPPSNTPVCFKWRHHLYATAATIIPLLLFFFAITWRLFLNSNDPYTPEGGIKFLFCGDYVPIFLKALLRDGQMLTFLNTDHASHFFSLLMHDRPYPKCISGHLLLSEPWHSSPNAVLMNAMDIQE